MDDVLFRALPAPPRPRWPGTGLFSSDGGSGMCSDSSASSEEEDIVNDDTSPGLKGTDWCLSFGPIEKICFLQPQRAREGLARPAKPLSACTAH
jgi:hypothetical protein